MRTPEPKIGQSLASPIRLLVPILLVPILLVPGAGLEAQSRNPITRLITDDGSRFLLLPTGGPPVVHWVVITPAGILEDPVGLGGLSHAAALAALGGTRTIGSLDPEAEPGLLRQVDRLEQEIAALHRSGAEVGADLVQQLAAARQAAAALSDPAAWWRSLLSTPAYDIRHQLLQDATVLSLTTTTLGMAGVASLLRERRERALLRGVHAEMPQLRGTAAAVRASTPLAELRAEMLAMAFAGHPFGRLWARPGPPHPLTRQVALSVWRQTQRPSRSLHVLVGGFNLADAQSVLQETFRSTELSDEPAPKHLEISRAKTIRRASVPGGSTAAMVVGIPLPERFNPNMLHAVTQWIAGGEDSYIARGLEAAGYEDFRVEGLAPFPSPANAGLMLIEVEIHAGDPAADDQDGLREHLDSLLTAASEQGLLDSDLRPVIAEMEARHTSVRGAADSIAYELAIQCGLLGQAPESVLGPFVAPSRFGCMELIGNLGWGNRIEVEWELH